MRKVLTGEERDEALQKLPRWTVTGKELVQERIFPSFREAIGFVNAAAEVAEEMNHHPDLDIRYNRVRIALTTHDSGGLTRLDIVSAARLDEL